MKEGKTQFISANKPLFTMHEARDQSMSQSMSPRYRYWSLERVHITNLLSSVTAGHQHLIGSCVLRLVAKSFHTFQDSQRETHTNVKPSGRSLGGVRLRGDFRARFA